MDLTNLRYPQNANFGWARLEWQNAANGYPGSVTLIDYAYNDVLGAPINAGQVSDTSTPEPDSKAMGLLVAGAAGVLAWRRRRKQSLEQQPDGPSV